MYQQLEIPGVSFCKPVRVPPFRQKLFLQERDLRVIHFLLEMKFASVNEIAERFFRKSDGQSPTSVLWTRDRLYKLRLNGLITPVQFPGKLKNFYQASQKGFKKLKESEFEEILPGPISKPNYADFEHDLVVLKIRLKLELGNPGSGWISERSLRSRIGLRANLRLARGMIPDGIYIAPDGKRVAIEFENSQKTKSYYRQKISWLSEQIRKSTIEGFEIDRVLFICRPRGAYRYLAEQTRFLNEHFQILTLEEFLSSNQTF